MSKVNVFITVDTEHSIGGAFREPKLKPVGNEKRIYGKIGDKYYGIPLIMDIADSYNIPVTFFVEVLNKYYFGEKESKEVCQYILGRGHDVQLHLHPNYLNFTKPDPGKLYFSDNMSDYSLERQAQLIKEGKDLLTRYGVKPPIAFRAGNFGADRNTLKALKQNDFLIDSSYNLAFPQKSRLLGIEHLNDIIKINDIYELPITCFKESIPLIANRIRPLDLNSASFNQIKKTLEFAHENNMHCVTIILHSFSFIHSKDVQYAKVKIRKNVIQRFKKICSFLSENSQYYRVRRLDDFSIDKDLISNNNRELLTKASMISAIGHYTEKILSKIRYEL